MAKISWNFHTVCHSVEKREILSHQKMFRQIKSLVTYLVKLFHRILAKNAMISTVWWKVWKLQKLTLKQFWDFREINIYNEITKELIWRNIFDESKVFIFSHCAVFCQYAHEIFREINLQIRFMTEKVDFTEIFGKNFNYDNVPFSQF